MVNSKVYARRFLNSNIEPDFSDTHMVAVQDEFKMDDDYLEKSSIREDEGSQPMT